MLNLYNTLTRKKEAFKPIERGKVRFYHCGPTVYWTQHIGNMRAMVMADVIRRSLLYLGYEVSFVRNYTDVGHLVSDSDEGEDKINKAVKSEKISPEEVADKYIRIFEKDTRALNILEPTQKPRATLYIDQIIKMVQTLIDKNYAYVTENAVYFDISKAKDYNALNRQDPNQLLHGAGTAAVKDPNKKNPGDFALWFFKTGAHKNALQVWKSPFQSPAVKDGLGFPGWHIECSTFVRELLGDTIDIHMGGVEHIPIHHTNEIAQSEAANDTKFVNYWLHNEHLLVGGKKMAKSEGTSYSLDEVIDKGFDPLSLRYFFLGAHYRAKQNFTWEALEGAQNALKRLKIRFLDLPAADGRPSPDYAEKFKNMLEDDFDVPSALALVWDLLKDGSVEDKDKGATLLEFDEVLGLGLGGLKPDEIPEEIMALAAEREKARGEEKWDEADKIREEIRKKGYEIDDTDGEPKITKIK